MDRIGDRILQASFLLVPVVVIGIIIKVEGPSLNAVAFSAVALAVFAVAAVYLYDE